MNIIHVKICNYVIMPAVSRFGGGNRAEKKKRVIDRLMAYYEKYVELVGIK